MGEENIYSIHLGKNAALYFTDFSTGPVQVDFIGKQTRPNSSFYRFTLRSADRERRILVKTPPARKAMSQPAVPAQTANDDRPRLTSKADLATKSHLEYKMLSTLQAYFSNLNDPRYGTLHVLDFLPEQRAIIMEEEQAPSLRQVFAKTNRLKYPFRSTDLSKIFFNAGAWLRAYHALPKLDHTQVRHDGGADFIESISSFTHFLAVNLQQTRYFQSVETITNASAARLLPEQLPLGLGHGDYAMRNILVGPQSRVIVFDTLGRWQVPIYEDIAYFLFRLKSAGIQAVSQGLAFSRRRLKKYEQEFLCGYFGAEPIPYTLIRLFEIQALLDYWSSQALLGLDVADKHKQSFVKKVNFMLLSHFLRGMLNQLLREVERKTPVTSADFRKTA